MFFCPDFLPKSDYMVYFFQVDRGTAYNALPAIVDVKKVSLLYLIYIDIIGKLGSEARDKLSVH